MKYSLPQIAKSVTAGVVAAGTALTAALLDGHIDDGELITTVVSTVVAVAAVFQVSNAKAPSDPIA